MRIILLGPPGAGKGTQASTLAKQLDVPHVATGDIFRENVSSETDLGKLAKEYMNRGELVPDDVTISMVLERLTRSDCLKGVVLDGFPRTITQAEALDHALKEIHQSIDLTLLIDVPEDELVKRLSNRWVCQECHQPYNQSNAAPKQSGTCDRCSGQLEQRLDDTPDRVHTRIQVYSDQTTPLVGYYQGKGKLRKINGQQSIATVADDLIAALGRQGSLPL